MFSFYLFGFSVASIVIEPHQLEAPGGLGSKLMPKALEPAPPMDNSNNVELGVPQVLLSIHT